MQILIGISVAIIGVFVVFILGLRNRWLFCPLMIAWGCRAGAALFHAFVMPLPDGAADALRFDHVARSWANQFGCSGFFNHFDPSASYVYSSIIAIFYACVDYSRIAAQFLNVGLGALGVAYLSLATNLVWGQVVARRVSFILAFYPTLVLYSAITLREAFIFFFISSSVYCLVKYTLTKRFRSVVAASTSLLLASFLHGAIALGFIAIFMTLVQGWISRVKDANQRVVVIVFMALATVLFIYAFLPTLLGISVGKVGGLNELDADRIGQELVNRAEGGAAYLTSLQVSAAADVLWQAPIRIAYFLFSPFVWDISHPAHLIGMLDGIFYLTLALLLIRGARRLPLQRVMCVVTLVFGLTVVYSFGTSNFGTAMRHRAKFFPAMLVVVAPLLSRRQVELRYSPIGYAQP